MHIARESSENIYAQVVFLVLTTAETAHSAQTSCLFFHLSVHPSHTYLRYILGCVPYLPSHFKPLCFCMPAHTTRRHYFLSVPQNKEEENRRELSQELLSSQPLVASISHRPVGRTVRTTAPSAWGGESGWAPSGIPQPCSKTDSVPALPSAKPSVPV